MKQRRGRGWEGYGDIRVGSIVLKVLARCNTVLPPLPTLPSITLTAQQRLQLVAMLNEPGYNPKEVDKPKQERHVSTRCKLLANQNDLNGSSGALIG